MTIKDLLLKNKDLGNLSPFNIIDTIINVLISCDSWPQIKIEDGEEMWFETLESDTFVIEHLDDQCMTFIAGSSSQKYHRLTACITSITEPRFNINLIEKNYPLIDGMDDDDVYREFLNW